MFWPAKVSKPADEPEGESRPAGYGLSSVAAGDAKLLLVTTIVVVWLKPSWFVLGLVENLPFTSMRAIVTGDVNMPKLPRNTVWP